MKIVSAGVLIHYDNKILGCEPYGKKGQFDIPKGKMDENESFEDAAIREVFEETGIRIKPRSMKSLGLFKYQPNKDLYLFSLELKFNPSTCECTSEFEFYGRMVPEVIGYKSIDYSDVSLYFYKSLQPILTKIIEDGVI